MVDSVPPKAKEEKLPIFMVTGAGDTGETRAPNNASAPNGLVPISAISTVWTGPLPLRRLPHNFRHSWRDRWPEYLSACWMTFVLFGISFLIFYIAGLVIHRQQAFVVLKCNTTDSNMYYHTFVNDHVHFSYYGEFLSMQAMKYPNCHHHIYFLFDDSRRDILRRTLFGKAVPNKGNVISTREIKTFQRRFRNTKITVMSLKEFFATSPMKEIWKSIPPTYLAFYARLYSVWENGGMAIDLDTYNRNYAISNNKLEHYIKDYQKKVEEIKQNEKEKNSLIYNNMGSATIFFSYAFVRLNGDDQHSNITNNIAVPQGETNSTEVVQKSENLPNISAIMINETKTNIFTNKTADNNNTGEFHNAVKDINVTTNNINERNIETLSISDVIGNVSNKTADNNTAELNKINYGFNVTANKTNDNNIETLLNPLGIMLMNRDTVKIGSFEDMISQPDMFSQQFEVSVSGQGYERPYFGNESDKLTPPVLAIESCGTFVASVTMHHKLLDGLMSCKCRWLPPKFLIDNIMNNKCSPEMYDYEICPHIILY